MTYTAPRRRPRAAVGLSPAFVCWCGLVVVAGCALAGGCDKGESHPAPPTTRSSKVFPDDPGPPGVRQPGWAKGRVVGEDGKPVAVERAKVFVVVTGVGSKTGESVRYTVDVGPDGTYAQKLVAGSFFPIIGQIDVPFNGRAFPFDLEPVRPKGEDPEPSTDAAKGLVQDFVWKLSGPRPGVRADQTAPATRYGGAIVAQYAAYRQDLERAVPNPPPGTTVTFTATPAGRLADGRDGQPKSFGPRRYAGPTGLEDKVMMDLPLAVYKLKGVEQTPDGRTRNLLFLDKDLEWREEIEGSFVPDLDKHWLDVVKVTFTRPLD